MKTLTVKKDEAMFFENNGQKSIYDNGAIYTFEETYEARKLHDEYIWWLYRGI